MAVMTKAQARTVIRALMSDQSKQAWSDAALDVITGMVIDEIVADVIEHAKSWRSTKDNVLAASVTSPGYLDLTSAGPLTKRFFRLQSVKRDSQEFSPIDPRDVVMFGDAEIISATFGYYVEGSKLWLFPLNTALPLEVSYSFLPPAYTGLADTASVDFYDGLEGAFIHEVVSRTSGNLEMMKTQHAISDMIVEKLKSIAKRLRVGPNVIGTYDADIERGGEAVQ